MGPPAGRYLLPLALASVFACGDGEVAVEDDVAVSIAAPVEGAVVRRPDDVDPDAAGIQVDVVVRVEGAIDGTVVLLGTSSDLADAAYAYVEAGEAVFEAFDLPAGMVTLNAATATCNDVACTASIEVAVVDSDTQVAIASPSNGDVVGIGDVELTIVRVSGAAPESCLLRIDGAPVGNFFWTNSAAPLVVASTLAAGEHVAQAFCQQWLDTIPTQEVSFTVDGTAPLAPRLISEPAGPGSVDFDLGGAYINQETTDVSPDVGLQHGVTVTVDGHGESMRGWAVRLSVTPPGGVEAFYEQMVDEGADPIDVTFDEVDFGDLDGDIVFRVVVLDAVGRTSPADSATLIIDRTAPTLVLTVPDPLQLILSRANDLEPATFDSVEVDFTVMPTDAVGEVAFQLDAQSPVAVAVAPSVVFPRASLTAGDYVATFAAVDVAGNVGTLSYAFSVATFANSVVIETPVDDVFNAADDGDSGAVGLQVDFTVAATGFEDGATVILCSTIDAGTGLACAGGGFVVGTGVLTGDLLGSVATFTVTLADGAQTLHAEAFEIDDLPHESSASRDVLVDTVPPVFVAVAFPGNDAGNDAPGVVRFAASELDGDGNLAVVVTVAGLELGQLLTVLVDGIAVSSGNSPFALTLTPGQHSVAFAMADVAGNAAVSANVVVELDAEAGTVVVDPPTASPYTIASTTVGVTISDTSGGGTLLLERYAGLSGGSALGSASSSTLANGQTRFDVASFVLGQGLNYLQATYTDAFGNVAISDRVVYAVDALGPSLTLGVRSAAGVVQSCGTLGSSCLADTLPFDSSTRRISLDKLAASSTCGGFGPCSPDGTDLFFTLAQCVNSDTSLESCPVTVRLQSRLPGDPDWLDVFAGTFSASDVADASILTGPEFEPGVTRELRLVTADSNGNPGVSNSVYLTLNFAGVVIVSLERLDAAFASTGDLLADDRYYGIAEDILDPVSGRFQTNFAATLDAYGVAPTSVRLTVDNFGGQAAHEVAVGAPFAAVELEVATNPASPSTNAITVEAMCGPDPCGTRAFSGIVADIVAPTYEFDRCSLCANAVPLVSLACPAACGDTSPASNIAGPGAPAIWNLAQDADHDGGSGFNTTVVLDLAGVEDGRTVRLVTDLGVLAGNAVSSDGCAGGPSCSKLFALTASHLPGTEVRRISVSFTDRAGNVAVPPAARIDAVHESIYARTDVIAPAGVQASACIGESTAIDAPSIEGPLCAAACSATNACDRTAASAALTFAAPGDDGASGTVVSYLMGVAALGIPYGATTYTSCDQVTTSGPFEATLALPGPPRAGGGIEQLAVPDLYPHRDYCFLVVATDDVGNSSPAGSFVSRRKIPLVTTPTPQSFDGVVRDDAQPVGAFHTEPSAPSTYGAFATSLPDLDGDGRDDFAVTQLTSGSVQLYLSTTPFVPAVTINAPAIAYSGTFGSALAGGDFDGDGLGDLVICDPTLTTSGFPGAGAHGGALFLYYGVAGSGVARSLNTTTPQVPSYHPDTTLLGFAGAELCAFSQLGDVTGDGVDDLVAAGMPTSSPPFVYVVNGGDRARLGAGVQAFSPGSDADMAAGAISPRGLALGDFDGDGTDEIAVADTADAVFVLDGGSPVALVFHPTAAGFATTIASVRTPRGTAGDWLLVGATDDNVYVFATGFMSDAFPLGSYVTLDNTGWDGVPAPLFGRSLASIGNFDGQGGPDIAVGPGFIYGFDTDTDTFEKRAILQGGAGFASQLAGVRGYQPGSSLARSQLLVVQRGAARLFMFR